jgi:hypothetical protein
MGNALPEMRQTGDFTFCKCWLLDAMQIPAPQVNVAPHANRHGFHNDLNRQPVID